MSVVFNQTCFKSKFCLFIYIYIYIYIYITSLSLSLSIYIYIYIERERERGYEQKNRYKNTGRKIKKICEWFVLESLRI